MKQAQETRKIRFNMNANGFNMFEVYDVPVEDAEYYTNSGVAVEVEIPAEIDFEDGEAQDGV